MLRRLIDFFTNMDARAWRTVAVSFVLFGGVGVVFLFGAQMLGLNGEVTVEQWLSAAHGPWALPVAVGAFAVLAFIGVPQFVLIAAAVVAFGPWTGFAYSWIGTLVSSLVGFWLGRTFGGRLLQDLAGDGGRRHADEVARLHGWHGGRHHPEDRPDRLRRQLDRPGPEGRRPAAHRHAGGGRARLDRRRPGGPQLAEEARDGGVGGAGSGRPSGLDGSFDAPIVRSLA
jgi:hypothetical protein